jgi:hypothetical protein
MTTYRVSGPHAFRGNEPGSTFEADPKDPQVVRAVTRGSISEGKAKGSAPKSEKPGGAGEKGDK